jgi:hypothetical protein
MSRLLASQEGLCCKRLLLHGYIPSSALILLLQTCWVFTQALWFCLCTTTGDPTSSIPGFVYDFRNHNLRCIFHLVFLLFVLTADTRIDRERSEVMKQILPFTSKNTRWKGSLMKLQGQCAIKLVLLQIWAKVISMDAPSIVIIASVMQIKRN